MTSLTFVRDEYRGESFIYDFGYIGLPGMI